MTSVFVGGSRKARINDEVRGRLENVITSGYEVLVGDANGVDKAVQRFLRERAYPHVTVYCSGQVPRNNIGEWPLRTVAVKSSRRDRRFYSAKDRVMTTEATHGLMIWDGESVGTLQNVVRLILHGKPVVLYAVRDRSFSNLKTMEDWRAFCSRAASEATREAERAVRAEAPAEEQPSLW